MYLCDPELSYIRSVRCLTVGRLSASVAGIFKSRSNHNPTVLLSKRSQVQDQ